MFAAVLVKATLSGVGGAAIIIILLAVITYFTWVISLAQAYHLYCFVDEELGIGASKSKTCC
jgi:hypothetical protein